MSSHRLPSHPPTETAPSDADPRPADPSAPDPPSQTAPTHADARPADPSASDPPSQTAPTHADARPAGQRPAAPSPPAGKPADPLPARLRAKAMRQLGAFTREQALAHGMSADDLDRMLRSGRLVAVRRRVYADAQDVQAAARSDRSRWLMLASARCLVTKGDPVVSHATAAVVHGFRLLHDHPPQPTLTVPGRAGLKERGLVTADLPAAERWTLGDVAITSAPRTLADCCRSFDQDAAQVLADSALAQGVSLADALAVLSRWARWPGTAAARDVLLFADPRLESALESLARLWFREQGLPMPLPQVRILSAGGRLLGRVDFLWPDLHTVCEMDGAVKYGPEATVIDGTPQRRDTRVVFREKRREDELRNAGLEVVRGYWSDGNDRGARLAALVREAFERAQVRSAPRTYRVEPTSRVAATSEWA